jgi:hypothetical protein
MAYLSKCAIAFAGLTVLPGFGYAATISAADIYAFRVASGPNTAGFGDNDVLTFGVNVAPNGFGEDAGVVVLDENGDPAPPTI